MVVSGELGAVTSSDAEANESGDESNSGAAATSPAASPRALPSGSSIWKTDVNPPDVRTGFGDLIVMFALGLMTIGSGLLADDWLPLFSKSLTSEVVGGMGVSSVGRSTASLDAGLCCVESLLGLGGAAGFLAAAKLASESLLSLAPPCCD